MKKDLILDRFGRYFEIPKRLADRGTRIHMVTYSYRRRRREKFPISAGFLINSYGITAFPAFLWQIAKSARSGQFSTVIGSADTPYCLIAVIVGRLFGLRSVCDIYDNFETYDSARLPLMMRALKWVLRNADVNIAFEDSLARHIHQHYQASVSGIVPNGADPDIFYPRDKNRCRTLLGINQDVPVIGYFGSLTAHRGTTVLLDAFARITCHYPDAVFLMAGSGSKHLINSTVNIYHLGIIPQAQVAEAIGASDVATICYADNAFGTFSFPQKMMEYIACQVPFVAPAIGGSQQFLAASPQFLYEIGNDEELANKIIDLLSESMPALPDVVTWDDAAEKFLDCIDQPRLNVTVPPPLP